MTSYFLEELVDSYKITCASCGVDVFDDSGFCSFCKAQLPFNDGKTCVVCGVKILGDEDCCGQCTKSKVLFDRAISSFDYVGIMRRIIKNLKYGNYPYVAKVLATYMAKTLMESGLQVDVVVAVPLTERTQKLRGYNQAELLAREICHITGLPLVEDVLIKIKETPQQEKLSLKERRKNLLGAFSVTDGSVFAGKNVLVVDDVKTTGTTLNRIAKILKKNKAKAVFGLTAVSVKEKITTIGNKDKKRIGKNSKFLKILKKITEFFKK